MRPEGKTTMILNFPFSNVIPPIFRFFLFIFEIRKFFSKYQMLQIDCKWNKTLWMINLHIKSRLKDNHQFQSIFVLSYQIVLYIFHFVFFQLFKKAESHPHPRVCFHWDLAPGIHWAAPPTSPPTSRCCSGPNLITQPVMVRCRWPPPTTWSGSTTSANLQPGFSLVLSSGLRTFLDFQNSRWPTKLLCSALSGLNYLC